MALPSPAPSRHSRKCHAVAIVCRLRARAGRSRLASVAERSIPLRACVRACQPSLPNCRASRPSGRTRTSRGTATRVTIHVGARQLVSAGRQRLCSLHRRCAAGEAGRRGTVGQSPAVRPTHALVGSPPLQNLNTMATHGPTDAALHPTSFRRTGQARHKPASLRLRQYGGRDSRGHTTRVHGQGASRSKCCRRIYLADTMPPRTPARGCLEGAGSVLHTPLPRGRHRRVHFNAGPWSIPAAEQINLLVQPRVQV